jgi:hypothetical protein
MQKKTYKDPEFGLLTAEEVIKTLEFDPDSGEIIGTSEDEIYKLPNGEFCIIMNKIFKDAPNNPISSRHFVLRDWLKKINSEDFTTYKTPITHGDEQEGNKYVNISKTEIGDYFVNVMEVHFGYDNPHESKWYIKKDWIEILSKY